MNVKTKLKKKRKNVAYNNICLFFQGSLIRKLLIYQEATMVYNCV